MKKIIYFIVGVFLVSLGFTFCFLYLNLLYCGYNFFSYVQFICKRVECLVLLVGLLFIFLAFKKERTCNAILL